MKWITYKGETHTFTEWCRILRSQPTQHVPAVDDDIADFVQALEPGAYSNASLYQLYTMFTDNPVSKQIFEHRVNHAFRKFRPDVVRYKTRYERGWRIL